MSIRLSTRASSAALALSTLLLAACGSSNNTTGGGGGATPNGITATKVASIAAEVPSAIAAKGTLTVAADASYAPNEFFDTDGKTVIGMDADLAKALAEVMGLKADVVNAAFDSILPGLTSGKYDLGASSFTDTKDREKTVDFVTYFTAGTSFFVKASGGPAINTLDDLCGQHVSVEKGTTQQDDATAQDTKCKGAGKPGVDVQIFPDQSGANLALSSGRVDASMADSPVAAYQVKQSNGAFKLSGQPYGTAPYGLATNKGNGLDKPVLDAVKELIRNGIYKRLLDKWGVATGAISNPQINGAQS
ncbi:MAG TPA: ABC transporter substrate-binding protein [Candidatus Angelobacter sp.]|jgi:polar amino acid transport system substrate-binding protein|nr:ABC transporter substrate-binding protein [Candidatus Angelobacter sp.]